MHITNITSSLLRLTFSIKKMLMLIITGIHGRSRFCLWAKSLESIQFIFLNWHVRQCASPITHLAFNPVHLRVKQIIFIISLIIYSKTANGFSLQPSVQVPPFSGSIFLLSLSLPNRSQNSLVHPYLCTFIHTLSTLRISSHIKTLPTC